MEIQIVNKLDLSWIKDKRDKHINTVIKIAESLSVKFPYCGIGISGSVSKLQHKESSDIDLLIVDNSFLRNRQCVFFKCFNLTINMLCISPQLNGLRFPQWTINFIGQHLNYFNSAKIIYDPNKLLDDLQERTSKSIELVQSSEKSLIDKIMQEIEVIIHNSELKEEETIFQRKISLMLNLSNLWYVKKGKKNMSKYDHLNAFQFIKMNDPSFYKLLYEIQFSNKQINTGEILKVIKLILA